MASLLELLVARKIITTDQAREASDLAEGTGAFIGRILIAQGAVEEDFLAAFLAKDCIVRPQGENLRVDRTLIHLLPERLMRRYRMVPLLQDAHGVLSLAVSEPLSIGGIDQIKRRLGLPLRLIMVDPVTIDELLAGEETVAEKVPAPRPPDVEPQESPLGLSAEPSSPEEVSASTITEWSPHEEEVSASDSEAAQEEEVGFARAIPLERHIMPVGWRPSRFDDDLPDELDTYFRKLRQIVEGHGQKYVALVGSDGARDAILRKLFWECWSGDDCVYVDLVAWKYPDSLGDCFPVALVIDGIGRAEDDEEGEQIRLLQDIGTAYSSKVPLLVGIKRNPKETETLSGGLKLTLGLATIINADVSVSVSGNAPLEQIFTELVAETIQWSEEAFPGAGLKSLLDAVSVAFLQDSREEALSKGSAAVERRLSHLADT